MGALADEIEAALPGLPVAEQKIVRHLLQHRQQAVLGSAAQIAEAAGTSDATVVRTARSLGYDGLGDLRAALLDDLISAPRPAERLTRTLNAASATRGGVLAHVLAVHHDALAAFGDPGLATSFDAAATTLAEAPQRHVFGVGPSGMLADYATLQFNRIGLRTTSLNATGIALADRLLMLDRADAVMIIAYAPLYREVKVTLERANTVGAHVILVSDSLGPLLKEPVDAILSVPRGRAGHLATHGATMVLLDAMVAALAARRGTAAIESLSDFAELRGRLDRSWSRRGARKQVRGEA